jgi:hypothetical protein
LVLAVSLVACGTDEVETSSGEKSIENWLPLDGEGAWTWRDDEQDTAPHEATLLHGRDMGQGRIEIRRGSTWADAELVGEIGFSTDDGLRLESLDLAGRTVGQPRLLAPALVQDAAVVSQNGWSCDVTINEEIDTFYALFDRTLVSRCEGNQLPAGTWVFAEDMGLVAIRSRTIKLELVAPW